MTVSMGGSKGVVGKNVATEDKRDILEAAVDACVCTESRHGETMCACLSARSGAIRRKYGGRRHGV